MINLPLNCLNLISSIFLTLITFSCNNINKKETYVKDDYKAISNYLAQKHKINLTENINKLFVLTENGCHTCNKKFSELVQNNLNNENSLFIITAIGNQIDMTPFEAKKSNVVVDKNITDTTLNILNETKVIYLKNKKIDTIITIDAMQIENQFEIIKTRK